MPRELLLHTDQLMPPLKLEKIGFERFEEKEMDYADGDRRIIEGKEVVVEKEWQQFRRKSSNSINSSNSKRSTVNTMSVLINLCPLQRKY